MKICKAVIFLLLLGINGAWAQEGDAMVNLFNDQIEAFNKKDVSRLVENVSEDFKYFYITSNELVLEAAGKEKFRQSMEAYFGSGYEVTSKIISHEVVGNKISFKEEVSYLNKEGKRVYSSALGTFEIKNGKITRSWYFVD